MHSLKPVPLLIVILLSFVLHTHAQESAPPQPPQKYRLELVYIFDSDSKEYIFVIGNGGFKSITSLKKFLNHLPRGTILEWEPGCVRMGDEPLLSSQQDMDDFKAFCAERGIKFILLPSG